MSDTVTIEAVDLTDYDWTPRCEVLMHMPDDYWNPEKCTRPAAFVIEVNHCITYRLFTCRLCLHSYGHHWLCRICKATLPALPTVIGEAS